MNQKTFKGILLVSMLIALPGCLKTRSEVRAIEAQHEAKEKVVAQQRAESMSRIDELAEQNRALFGKIESLENRLAESERSREEQRIKSENLETTTREKIKVYEETIDKLETQLKNAPKATAAKAGGAKQLSSLDKANAAFNAKDWKEAVLNYQKYRDANPQGKSYADATYKIGVSFQELGLKAEAKAFYDEVIAKFPKNPNANRARTRLKTLN